MVPQPLHVYSGLASPVDAACHMYCEIPEVTSYVVRVANSVTAQTRRPLPLSFPSPPFPSFSSFLSPLFSPPLPST